MNNLQPRQKQGNGKNPIRMMFIFFHFFSGCMFRSQSKQTYNGDRLSCLLYVSLIRQQQQQLNKESFNNNSK